MMNLIESDRKQIIGCWGLGSPGKSEAMEMFHILIVRVAVLSNCTLKMGVFYCMQIMSLSS